MKTYSVIYRESLPFLRQDNPLRSTQHLVSREAYADHERLYIDSALIVVNPVDGKTSYTENELSDRWQYLEDGVWIDVSEPNLIDTQPQSYRQVFFVVDRVVLDYQARIENWVIDCFGTEIASNIPERVLRFIEEAAELAQSLGVTREQIYRVITYTFARPPGNPDQEVGGTMVTLAALCAAAKIDMNVAAETEYKRVLVNVDQIREKQEFKRLQNITA